MSPRSNLPTTFQLGSLTSYLGGNHRTLVTSWSFQLTGYSHDHHYAHEIINGCHVIRSGCDFKQLSYIEARKKSKDGTEPGWNFDIIRRDITSDMYGTTLPLLAKI